MLFKVRVGSSYHDKEGTLRADISLIIPHEWYDEDTYDYDVALIKVCSQLWFTLHNIFLKYNFFSCLLLYPWVKKQKLLLWRNHRVTLKLVAQQLFRGGEKCR